MSLTNCLNNAPQNISLGIWKFLSLVDSCFWKTQVFIGLSCKDLRSSFICPPYSNQIQTGQKSHLPTLHYEIQSQKIKWVWKFYFLLVGIITNWLLARFFLELSKVKITSFKSTAENYNMRECLILFFPPCILRKSKFHTKNCR